MLSEILVSDEKSNFHKLFLQKKSGIKPIRLFLNDIYIPFGLEDYYNKLVLNFEMDDSENCKEYEKNIRQIEKHISELIEDEDIEVKSVFYKRNDLPTLCRAYIKKNRNKIITIYKLDDIDTPLYELKMKERYNIEIEVSGIWRHQKTAGIYLNIIGIEKK